MDFSSVTEPLSDLSNYVRSDGSPAEEEPADDQIIEFLCRKDHYGAIPEPIPANKVLPEWYKKLAPRTTGGVERENLSTSTVKRCMPFMEAMTMGWIIPLAAEVEFHASDGYVEYNWSFEKEMVSSHNIEQVGGEMFPNSDWPVLKFHNWWCISVPDGYSLLVTNPLNRIQPLWQTFSGVVDADRYFNFINAPFMWTGGEFDGVVDAGTPIVQVIPFKRDAIATEGRVREMTDDEHWKQSRTDTALSSQESLYRDNLWVQKRGSRNLSTE